MASEVKPRTPGERRAYAAGWANAVLAVQEQGMNAAVAELKLMVDAEPEGDPHRPCENPKCQAIDSTKCAFRITDVGHVHDGDAEKARAAGCRVVRFQ